MNRKPIPLDKSFQEVFSTYKEDYMHGMVLFEGMLEEKYEDTDKDTIMRFITGGAHVAKCHIEREGPYIKCRFKYNKPFRFKNFEEIKDDDETIKSIRKALGEGTSIASIIFKYDVNEYAIRGVKSRYGALV